MKTHLMFLIALACGALSACGSPDTPAPAVEADGAPPLSVEEGPANAPAPAAAHDIEVAFDHVRLEEREPGKNWAVRATLANKGSAPLYGGEFQIALHRKSEDGPFATHGTQVFFSPPVPPGRTTAFAASIPVAGIEERPPVDGAQASVKLVKTMPAPVIAEGWKPLDPATAAPKDVGEKILVTADGQRVVLPSGTAAPAPDSAAPAQASTEGVPSP